MSDESPAAGKIEPARPSEPPQEILRLTWEEVHRHLALTEFIRLDGDDMAGEAFWVIMQSSETHWVHVLAYGYRGVVGRAPAGALGVISIKPGDWGSIRTELQPDGAPRFQCGNSATQPAPHPGPELRIALGNLVDYVRGHSLVFAANARQLKFRYIKQWDLPMEFALSAGTAAVATRAETANKSALADRAVVSDQAIRVNLAGGAQQAPPPGDPILQLPQGKVHLLRKGGDLTLNILLDGPVMLRVFVPEHAPQSEAEALHQLERTARMESLVHMRLRPMQKSKGDPHDGLAVLCFDTASNKMRTESLLDRNLVGVVRLGDGQAMDAVKLREWTTATTIGLQRMVRIENLAPDLNVVVAVWIADPLLPRLKQGTKVGHDRFTLSRPLGAGGMGVVWMAFDEQLNEFVALKFLPPQVRNDPGALEDLRVETLKSRQLSHPHIIRIHDLHLSKDEPPFISMEYVDGATLHEVRLRQPHGVLSWPHLEPWITQLCQALDYAHREKVVHLDLKPSNLMIDDKGRLKLADFGLATAVADAASQTTPSLVKGTLGYMSPQQLQGKRGQVSDDIYALGATLYTLMTSHAPFHTGNVVEQVLNATPLTMAEKLAELGVQADIPAPVSEVVMLCLERDPSRRPRSALAVTKTIVQNMANQPPAANGGNLAPGAPRGPGGWLRNLLK